MTKNKAELNINNAACEAVKVISQAADAAVKVIATAASEARNTAIKASEERIANEQDSGKFSSILYKQISLGMSIISLAGILIGGYVYLTNPSRDNDTALKLQDQRIIAQRDTIDSLTKTQQNDTQEVKEELADLVTQIQIQANNITQLTTIINERIPAKK